MTSSRRDFVRGGAGLSLAAAVGVPMQAPARVTVTPGDLPAAPLASVVFDTRFADARAFATVARAQGIPVTAIAHDVTDVWLSELAPRWRKESVAVAGLTAECSFLCLERLARDCGLRAVYRGEHVFACADSVEHTLRGPAALQTRLAALADAPDWCEDLSRLLISAALSRPVAPPLRVCSRAARPAPAQEHLLVSWVLAA